MASYASVPILLLPLLLAACSEYGYTPEPPFQGTPAGLEAEARTDRFEQTTVQAVDVLWVIDDSCSMAEEQASLAANFRGFFDYFASSGLDYHIASVSTDMDSLWAGRLRDTGVGNWIDVSVEDPIRAFEQSVVLGTAGSGAERGRDAVFKALDPSGGLVSGWNGGFYREEANLAVVVISDENDDSVDISVDDFASWLTSLKADPSMVSFSAIVGLPTAVGGMGGMTCYTATSAGVDYLAVKSRVGGMQFSICDQDWAPALDQLGMHAAGLRSEFFLSEVPVEDTLEVVIDGELSEPVLDWRYMGERNSILFVSNGPRPGSELLVTYEVRSEYVYEEPDAVGETE